jgi:hypothetical protein
MADERWERLAERQGIAYAKTVADAMNLKVDMDSPADREKLRRAILELVAGRKRQSKDGLPEIFGCLSDQHFFENFVPRIPEKYYVGTNR